MATRSNIIPLANLADTYEADAQLYQDYFENTHSFF